MIFKMKMRNANKSGYTLIELLITITIIAILAGIAVIGYIGLQQNQRDTIRNTRTTILAEALENYYNKHGEYPSVVSLTNKPTSVVKIKLGVADADSLVFPQATDTTQASIAAAGIGTEHVVYAAGTTDASKDNQCNTDPNGYCDAFKLQYKKEDGNTVTINSRHDSFVAIEVPTEPEAPLTAPAKPSMTAAKTGSSTVTFTAGSACDSGTIQYKIRYNTSSSLPDWSTVSWTTDSTKTIDPGSNTVYYSQSMAQCVSGSKTSPASDPSDVYMLDFTPSPPPNVPATPSISVGSVSSSYTTWNWSSVSCNIGSPQYEYYFSDSGSSQITSTSVNLYTYNPGSYYVYVKARCTTGSQSSAWSANSNSAYYTRSAAPPPVPNTPSTPYVYLSSGSSYSYWNWYSVSCNIGYPNYQYRFSYYGNSSYGTTTGTSVGFTTNTQGNTYSVSVQAQCVSGSQSSGWSSYSSQASYTYPITSKTQISNGSIILYARSQTDGGHYNSIYGRSTMTGMKGGCPSGLSPIFQYRWAKNNSWGGWSGYLTWYGSYTTEYHSDLDKSDMLESSQHSWCQNNNTGLQGTYAYTDNFGNAGVYENRGYPTPLGKWWRGCDYGNTSDPSIADVCVTKGNTSFPRY